MYVCIALLLVLIQRTSLSLHLRICVVVVALCALYACEMLIYWGNTSPKTATTTTRNNESRRIVLICHNLLFLLCLLCPRTRSAANCAARMRERRCWTQPNVRARSVCVVCWYCDVDVATRRLESAAESGKEREQTWEHRVVCFFAREYAYDCVTMCVCVLACIANALCILSLLFLLINYLYICYSTIWPNNHQDRHERYLYTHTET